MQCLQNFCLYFESKADHCESPAMQKALVFFLSFFLCCGANHQEKPRVKDGMLDLSRWPLAESGIIDLSGTWEVSPGQDIVAEHNQARATAFYRVPGGWDNKEAAAVGLSKTGTVSYRLRVRLAAGDERRILALNLGAVSSAYEFYANRALVDKQGESSPDSFRPALKRRVDVFTSGASDLELVLVVSDHTMGNGGIWDKISLGTADAIIESSQLTLGIDLFLLGTLVIMSLYHFGLYSIRRANKSALVFGLATMVLAIRVLVSGQRFINAILPEPDWTVFFRIEFLTFYMAVPIFYHFYSILFPAEFKKLLMQVCYGVGIVFSLSAIVLSIPQYRALLIAYQIWTILVVTAIIYAMMLAVVRRRKTAGILLVASIVLALCVVNDILYAMQKFYAFGYLAHYGFLVFIFSQALILALNFSTAFSENERLLFASARYIPDETIRELERVDFAAVQPGDWIEKDFTILFVDIRNYTTISEKVQPDILLKGLNLYLSLMEPIIRKNHGYIDKYIGDAIMALFPGKADDAVQAAIEMHTTLRNNSAQFEQLGLGRIETATGIHYGRVVLGAVGNSSRLDITVLSDAVNLASRIEGVAKKYGAAIVVSEDTMLQLGNSAAYFSRPLNLVRVKGRSTETVVYEILAGFAEADHVNLRECLGECERAFLLHRTGDRQGAAILVKQLAARYPEDSVLQNLAAEFGN